MAKVRVSGSYDVLIGEGLLHRAGELIAGVCPVCRVMLVSDSTVMSIYGEKVINSLESCGFEVSQFVIEPGEGSKNSNNLILLWEALASRHISRSDIIVALGGGVVGDLAGFAAATYLRAIKFVQLPTTLLAMVDSSVGGKTAVDLAAGKNLAGAFHRPALVLCDTDALSTLPPPVFNDGMAEVIKYGMINRPELLDMLEGEADIGDVVRICVEDKRDIVDADEFDNGERRLLNFGHTLGHGIELLSDYRITHGRAVAAGMAIIAKASAAAFICPVDVYYKLTYILSKYDLPVDCDFSARELCNAALGDKKRQGKMITLVVPCGKGKTVLAEIPFDDLYDFIAGAWSEE